MKVTIFISFLLAFLGELNVVNGGGQIALRPRPKNPILSRSIASDGSMFDPTDEESFYVSGADPNTVIKTIHQASRRKFVNFEKFEDYLLPQKSLCTPSPEKNEITVLNFPLNREHYLAACERWAGEKMLVFIGHHPSCYAPVEERSAFKSLSIAFDDASMTIRVTGKPLRWGDRHFPAPAELIIGRPPSDVVMTRRSTSEEDFSIGDFGDCVKHPMDCGHKIINKLTMDIDTADVDGSTIDFNGENNEAHKKYWPPDALKDKTGVPELFELYCLECRTTGAMEQVFHISFNPVDGSDDDDDDDKDDDKEDEDLRLLRRDINDKEDDADFAELWKNHVKRAFVAYSVTEEIKIRQQFEFLLPLAADIYCSIIIASLWTPPGTVSCAPAWTAGGLQWEKASATHSKVDRAKSTGPKEVGNPKAGSGSSAFGYSIWPMEVGVVGWLNIGVGAKANLTLPGFEATIEVGSEFEVDLMGDHEAPVDLAKFDPIIEILPPDLTISSADVHVNVAVGPKAGINIGLPVGNLGIGAGIRLDLIRIDNKMAEYSNVTSSCTVPKTKKETIKNAFGYTMDLKTGVYAFMNIAGFYIDTSWIGNKMPGSEFSGLYWGVKNLVAKCSSCGNTSCVSQSFNDLFDKAKKTLGMDGTKFRLHKLLDTEHVSKDSISSLDKHMNGTDMPTGNIEDVCVVRPRNGGPKFRRGLFGGDDDDDKKRDPCKAYNQADP